MKLLRKRNSFSFGTNDLTQMTFGFSRDDAGGFLNDYYEKKIFEHRILSQESIRRVSVN